MNRLLPLIYLHSIGFTQRALSRIFEKEENYEDFYNKLDYGVLKKLGFQEERIEKMLAEKQKLDTEKISNLVKNLEVKIITIHDPLYPELLKQVPVCPYFLYVR
ncbi:TPA: hypothetical protein DCZ36_01460, partial [Candidatus Gracilibacteria bacterium]|nr:hypothetical protein [Candidatus Gracilibacteria bacterium]